MNLLKDKRDDERPVADSVFNSISSGNKYSTDEAVPQAAQFETKTGSKNTLGALLVAALIFVIAIVVTYFLFFKDNKRVVSLSDSQPPVASVDSTQDKDSVAISTEVKVADVKTEEPDSSQFETSQESSASLKVASELMQTILNVLGSSWVTALFIDEGSFSAEVDAGSLEAAKNVYDSIKQSLPTQVKLTSSAPVNGSSALVAGTFTPSVSAAGAGLARDEIDKELREIARTANATISSLDIDGSSGAQNFVVMRIVGSFEICRLFVDKLYQSNLNVSISKLILMPGPSGDYTFVLRFYL